MGQRYGGKIVTDGLILCLDAHDAKSYAGEPITNLVTSTAVDFSVRSGYTGNTFSQVVDSESPSGYACEMSYTGTVNSASRCRFGAATNIPTSGTGFVSIWAKRSAGSSTTMRPKVYTGYAWYHLEPLDGGSIYFTEEYRPFGAAVTFGTNSGGPNPGFSMTQAGGSTANDRTRWIKPQVTTLSYNTPFANLSRSATDGWKDRTANSNDGTLTNMAGTGASHYRAGQVIMPVANSYLDFDGSDDRVDVAHSTQLNNAKTWEIWINMDSIPASNTYKSIFQKSANWNNNGGILLSMIYGNLKFAYGGYWGSLTVTANSNLSTNTWYQVVGTGEDTGSGILMKGYINGILQNSSTFSGAFVPTNTETLRIGHGNGGTMDGKIGLLRVYNGILTAAQILSNYNTTKGRFS